MDSIELLGTLGLVKLEWVGDRLGIADTKPRHIGRPITAEVIESPNASTKPLVGTLEARDGANFVISGKEYSTDVLQNVRIWRQAIRKDER